MAQVKDKSSEDWIPRPDPTLLTTAALQREIAALKELFETRLESHDKIFASLQTSAIRSPSNDVLNERLDAVKAVLEERFGSITTRFADRDARMAQAAQDNKTAVDAALKAAKEAVDRQNESSALAITKSESVATKQLEQLSLTFRETTLGISGKIDDLKDRLTQIEGRGLGRHDTWGSIAGTVATVGAAIVAVIAIVAFLVKS